MNKLSKKYEEYKTNKAEYIKIRKSLLKEPEEELYKVSEDLMLSTLRNDVEKGIKKKTDKAWKIYQKVYGGEPAEKDLDTFLTIVDEIMLYDEFITVDQMAVWKVSRDLVWAFREAFKGTQDEYDQKSVAG